MWVHRAEEVLDADIPHSIALGYVKQLVAEANEHPQTPVSQRVLENLKDRLSKSKEYESILAKIDKAT
jgi:hypothetical protein